MRTKESMFLARLIGVGKTSVAPAKQSESNSGAFRYVIGGGDRSSFGRSTQGPAERRQLAKSVAG